MTLTDTDSPAPAGGLVDHLNATAAPRALPGQRYTVELEDGTTFEVRTTNRDRVAWDMTSSKRKWPRFDQAPFLASTFVAWNAATRDGQTRLTFDQFNEQVAVCDPVTAEPGEPEGTDPTRRAAPPTSS